MTENGWQVVGRLAKARRERMGLKQDDLRTYGGPGVSTVGKIERAAQDFFPLRTQQQLEKALGWPRGTIGQVIKAVDVSKDWDQIGPDWELDLVDEDLPDLTVEPEPAQKTVTRARDLSDAELLAELTYRFQRYGQEATDGTPMNVQPKTPDYSYYDAQRGVEVAVELKSTTGRGKTAEPSDILLVLTTAMEAITGQVARSGSLAHPDDLALAARNTGQESAGERARREQDEAAER